MIVKNKHPQSKDRGFTLLLAALISSIVLSLGTAVFSIAQKEQVLSSVGRNSQFAFYAADTAAECALYWDTRSDIHPNTFATSTASTGSAASITCDQQSPPLTLSAVSANSATTTFSYAPNGLCATVILSKSQNASGVVTTVIHADGFSTKGAMGTCAADIAADAKALQRSIELRY